MNTSELEDLKSSADVAIQAALQKWLRKIDSDVFGSSTTREDLIEDFVEFLREETAHNKHKEEEKHGNRRKQDEGN